MIGKSGKNEHFLNTVSQKLNKTQIFANEKWQKQKKLNFEKDCLNIGHCDSKL